MKDKTILITGCSSGIGLAAAEVLRDRGYRVFASARGESDVAHLIESGFDDALQLDLDDSASIEGALEQLLDKTGGGLYALFNNGAYGQPGALEDLSREALRQQFETNLFGWHELTRRVIPVMRRQGGGRIIQNSSILGFAAMSYRGAYNSSKYALEGLSDTLRLELRGSGIHVCLIEPGPIESRFRTNAYLKWKQHVDPDASFHAETYRKMENRLTKEGPAAPFTLPASAVVEKLIHALESRRPRPRYPVTFPTHLFAILKRLLPTRTLDHLLARIE